MNFSSLTLIEVRTQLVACKVNVMPFGRHLLCMRPIAFILRPLHSYFEMKFLKWKKVKRHLFCSNCCINIFDVSGVDVEKRTWQFSSKVHYSIIDSWCIGYDLISSILVFYGGCLAISDDSTSNNSFIIYWNEVKIYTFKTLLILCFWWIYSLNFGFISASQIIF